MEEKKTNIYTKSGDKGMTSLKGTQNVSKSDDRIQLIGAIEELISHLGIVKSDASCSGMAVMLETIQNRLQMMISAVTDPYNQTFRLSSNDVVELEREIDRISSQLSGDWKQPFPGSCRASAQIDVARSVARRTERCMVDVARRHSIDLVSRQYMNRLSDYLEVSARHVDLCCESSGEDGLLQKKAVQVQGPGQAGEIQRMSDTDRHCSNVIPASVTEQQIIQRVLREIDAISRIPLSAAKKLIELLEKYSEDHGRKSVISVCGPDGNMIAVHAMDDAFIASFDISMKKAYTSVAVKMSTMELSRLAQPGQTFYGVENTDHGRIIIFGGGVPLVYQGKIIGGLGVSGGTGEEDHETAQYGLEMLESVLQ